MEEHLKMPHVVFSMVRIWRIALAFPFIVPIAVCLMLVPLDYEGFMTDSSVLGDEMM